jgi:hypothetical protein
MERTNDILPEFSKSGRVSLELATHPLRVKINAGCKTGGPHGALAVRGS